MLQTCSQSLPYHTVVVSTLLPHNQEEHLGIALCAEGEILASSIEGFSIPCDVGFNLSASTQTAPAGKPCCLPSLEEIPP